MRWEYEMFCVVPSRAPDWSFAALVIGTRVQWNTVLMCVDAQVQGGVILCELVLVAASVFE